MMQPIEYITMQLMMCGCVKHPVILAVIKERDMTFDVTTNRIPFGLLTPEEQATLKAWPHGWEYCSVANDLWLDCEIPFWRKEFVYRGKPAPKVKSYWFNIHGGDYIGHVWNSQADASCHTRSDSVLMRMDICNGEVTVTKET
jgi:hypothetical protein